MSRGPEPRELRAYLSAERKDVALLLANACVVIGTWFLIGWRPGLFAAGGDAIGGYLPYFTEVTRSGGDWHRLLFRGSWLGGAPVVGVFGLNPWSELAARLSLSLDWMSNGILFLVQTCSAYLSIRAMSLLAELWNRPLRSWREEANPALVWIFAFAPILGWKLSYGHWMMPLGTLVFIGACTATLALGLGRFTLTLAAVLTLTLVTALTSPAEQSLVYGCVFGLPIGIGILVSLGVRLRTPGWKGWLGLAALYAGGAGLAYPVLGVILKTSLSSDALRGFIGSGRDLVYSFLTTISSDLLSLPFWTWPLWPSFRDFAYVHETDAALGVLLPLVVLLAATRQGRKTRALTAGLLLSLTVALLFSARVPGFSNALLALIPPLGSFRVPMRSFLPAALFLPILAMSSVRPEPMIEEGDSTDFARGLGPWILLSVVIVALQKWGPGGKPNWASYSRELVTWLSIAWASVAVMWKGARPGWLPRVTSTSGIALFIGTASLLGFSDRLLPRTQAGDLLERFSALRSSVRQVAPDALTHPLRRSEVGFHSDLMKSNTGVFLGVSSISGYGYATRRFIDLIYALRGEPAEPTSTNVNPELLKPTLPVLRLLYNVEWDLEMKETGLQISRLSPGSHPAWFSLSTQGPLTRDDLATKLRLASADPESLRRAQLVAEPPHPPTLLTASCSESQVESVLADDLGQSYALMLHTQASCPLTLALNYSEGFEARARVGEAWVPVATYPAYGALIGLQIPAHATEVRLEFKPPESATPGWASVAGLLLAICGALGARGSLGPLQSKSGLS